MNNPTEARRFKRVRLTVRTDGGRVAATTDLRVEYRQGKQLQYVIAPEDLEEFQEVDNEMAGTIHGEEAEFAKEAMDEEIDVATQQFQAPPPEDLPDAETFSMEAGGQYYHIWRQGLLDDGAVAWRWGRAALETFRTVREREQDQDQREEDLEDAMLEFAIKAEREQGQGMEDDVRKDDDDLPAPPGANDEAEVDKPTSNSEGGGEAVASTRVGTTLECVEQEESSGREAGVAVGELGQDNQASFTCAVANAADGLLDVSRADLHGPEGLHENQGTIMDKDS